MLFVPNTLRLRLKYTWQRITRGYGDDEIDWELREKLAQEVKDEMEEKFGPQLAAMREHKRRVLACEDILADKSLSRESKTAKIREQFPGDTEEEVAQRAHYFEKIKNAKTA